MLCVDSAEERQRRMAMKSTRNPLSKQLPARRMNSTVRPSSKNASVTLKEEVTVQPESGVSEESGARQCEEQLTVAGSPSVGSQSASTTESPQAPLSQDSQHVASSFSSQVSDSFQAEFLKMLLQTKRGKSQLLKHVPKRPKTKYRSVDKLKKSARPAKSQGTKRAAASTCSRIKSQQTHTQDVDDTEYLTGTVCNYEYEQPSSVNCKSETVSSFVHGDGKLISSHMQQSRTLTESDVAMSPEHTSGSTVTAVSCEVVNRDDDELSAHSECSDSSYTDIALPVLSLPGPVLDVDSCPPVLIPSQDVSSADIQTDFNADVSVTYSACEQVKTSKNTGSELWNEKQYRAHGTETSSADVVDITDGSVGTDRSVASSVSVETTSSLMVSDCTVVVTAVNTQSQCTQETSDAHSMPTSSFRISTLAKFRPTFSASSVLVSTSSLNQTVPAGIRPNIVRNSFDGHSSSVIHR